MRLRKFPSGLRSQLVMLVVGALAPFLVLVAFVAGQHQINERGATQDAAQAVASAMTERLDARIGTVELALLALKHALSTSPGSEAANDRVLREFQSDLPPRYSHFAVVGSNGKNLGTSERLSEGVRIPIEFVDEAGTTLTSGFRLVGPRQLFGANGPQTLAVVYPLDSAGTRLVGFIPLSAIQREVLSHNLTEGSVAALVNASGAVVAASRNSAYWKRRQLSSESFAPADSDSGVGLLAGQDGHVLYSAYAKVQHAPYLIYVGTPEPLAFARARHDFWRAVGWGALAFLLGLVLAWTQATRIIRPLEQLAEDAAVLGGGELAHRSQIRSRDELGVLADSINAMAETLERRENEAIQTQKMESVGQLAGGIAHDFNNLLTVISGRLELLALGEDVTPDAQEDISEIRSATSRAISLTRQLLAFSRKQLLRPRVVDLNSIVDELEPMLRRLIGEDVQIIILRAPDLASIAADPGQIHQVLLNLALNARDAMPGGGLLRIETNNEEMIPDATRLHPGIEPGDYAVVSVTDTGHGMDERTKARIFDPFFTTKDAGKGTGLGLSTVYGIVKQSGAAITVDSSPGRGTTFRVFFPATKEGSTGEFPMPVRKDSRGSESILIVEDERAVRDLATKILESRGYKVISAAHGGDALQIMAGSDRRIDLVLTDVVMPGMGGRELVEALRKARPAIKVLYMSGYTDDEIVRRGLLDPSVDFVQKPFTAEDLAAQTRTALDA